MDVTTHLKSAHPKQVVIVEPNRGNSQKNGSKKIVKNMIDKYNLFLYHITPRWTWRLQD